VAHGLKNKEIANRLFISEITVRHHLTSIYSKLGVADRFELAVYASATAWPAHRARCSPVRGQACRKLRHFAGAQPKEN